MDLDYRYELDSQNTSNFQNKYSSLLYGETDSNQNKLNVQDNPHSQEYIKEVEDNKNYMNYYMHDPKLKKMNNPLQITPTVSTLEDHPNVKNHIIVCGIHTSI